MDRKATLCWFCDKATCSGCSWSKEFKPVEGWDAEPTLVTQWSGKGKPRQTSSYMVYSCPDFAEG